MRAGRRPVLTAGIALIGVSAIAMAPIVATPPDVTVTNQHVQLSTNPFDEYVAALERALENARRLLLQAVTDPALPPNLTLEDLVAGMFDTGGNVDRLSSILETISARPELRLWFGEALASVPAAIELAAVGNIEDAVITLILGATSLLNVATVALGLQTEVVGRSVRAAAGVALRGLGAGGVAARNLADALNNGDPKAVLNALATAPALITDAVLNGYRVGSVDLPGLLTPGPPFSSESGGPVSVPIGLTRAIRTLLDPQPDMMPANKQSANGQAITVDVPAGPGPRVVEGTQVADVDTEIRDPDEGTNKDVMTTGGQTDLTGVSRHGPLPFGTNSTSPTGGAAGMSTLRDGIRDRIQGFGDGVRHAVKTVTGRGDDDSVAGAATSESP